jgi:hypothetical protein
LVLKVTLIKMDTCPQELFDTCLVLPASESDTFTTVYYVIIGVCIGLASTVIARRYPLYDIVTKLLYFTWCIYTSQSTPKVKGSRGFLTLLFMTVGINYAADYYTTKLRGTRFFVEEVIIGALVVAVYLLGVGVHFYFTAQCTFFDCMDQHLIETSWLLWEYGWFYAVAVAQVALTYYAAGREVVKSSSELQLMRTAQFDDYRRELLKSGVFTAGMLGLQGLSLYSSTRSRTEICTSIAVVLALLGRLGV